MKYSTTSIYLDTIFRLGRLAQLVEQLTLNQRVVGSIPTAPTIKIRLFMPISPDLLKEMIEKALPGAYVSIQDTAGDNDHYAAVVKASQFKEKTMVQQHQMVYQALQGKIGTELHALALTTEFKED
jgi:stress-induced morphogen